MRLFLVRESLAEQTSRMRLNKLSDSSKRDLNRVEELIIEGRFALALQLVENLEKRERLTAADRLMCRLLKSTLLTKLGHFEEPFSFSKRN